MIPFKALPISNSRPVTVSQQSIQQSKDSARVKSTLGSKKAARERAAKRAQEQRNASSD